MILTCSACRTRFLVPDAAFAGRANRKVRCGRCRHEWLADAPVTENSAAPDFASLVDEAAPAPDYTPTAADRLAASLAAAPEVPVQPIPNGSNLPATIDKRFLRRLRNRMASRRSGALLLLALLLSLAALLALTPVGLAGLGWMGEKLQQVIHGTQAPRLLIRDIKTSYVPQTAAAPTAATDGATTTDALGNETPVGWSLLVEGVIESQSDADETVPPLRLITKDKNGARLGSYRPEVQQIIVPPHGTTGFSLTLGAADPALAEVTVEFAGDTAEPPVTEPTMPTAAHD